MKVLVSALALGGIALGATNPRSRWVGLYWFVAGAFFIAAIGLFGWDLFLRTRYVVRGRAIRKPRAALRRTGRVAVFYARHTYWLREHGRPVVLVIQADSMHAVPDGPMVCVVRGETRAWACDPHRTSIGWDGSVFPDDFRPFPQGNHADRPQPGWFDVEWQMPTQVAVTEDHIAYSQLEIKARDRFVVYADLEGRS